MTALCAWRLDEIDEALIEEFCQARRRQVSTATTNRALAVLRRMLRLGHEWRIIDRIPRIRLLRGERNREFVLSREQERIYLEFCPPLLHDAAALMLDTGLGPAEVLGLQWTDIHPDYLQVREGKTRYRARSLSLTSRLRSMLEIRRRDSASKFVFAGDSGKPPLPSSLAHRHAQVRRRLKLPEVFVLYSLRHTALTRLGETAPTPTPSCELLGIRRSPPRSATFTPPQRRWAWRLRAWTRRTGRRSSRRQAEKELTPELTPHLPRCP